MPPAARIGDMHTCPQATPGTPPVPHVGGPISTGCPTVLIGSMPAARVGDLAICVGPPDAIAMGSLTVLIGGMPAARIADTTVHGGVVTVGFPQVVIGDAGAGGASAGLSISPALYPQSILVGPGIFFTKYNSAIIIEGPPEFQAKVLADLQKIASTPKGKRLLESIDNSGKVITIVPGSPATGNCVYFADDEGYLQDGGKAGKGTDSQIEYNPDVTVIGLEEWETRPPAIGLAHELIHANQAAHGTMPYATTNNDTKPDPSDPTKIQQADREEVETVGIPPNDTREFTENKIRNEWDPQQPERQWY